MKTFILLLLPATALLILAGCSDSNHPVEQAPTPAPVATAPASPEEAAKIAANLGRLSPEDRTLAEKQEFCAVEEENRLGTMGTPVKVMVNDQPVFLCCKGCKATALAEPEKTLAKVQELKAKTPETPGH